ncbi:hypothetical protein [Larkinella terrae]|uniref:Uncharacterized protein n=1 Tax=Larkinella terrae TaxID=2025311 RepID=A0A7K0EQG9_9BACT|nr:hypothetical protein [Larkinella terrae]MRS64054.1 hypothetical protein [Larkinella terrae]
MSQSLALLGKGALRENKGYLLWKAVFAFEMRYLGKPGGFHPASPVSGPISSFPKPYSVDDYEAN